MAAAQDTAGEAAAGPFYDAANATFTSLVDPTHLVSSLYNMVNVPTGVLIDEEGTVVRWDEGTYTRTYSAGNLTFGTDDYVPAVRDWVVKGSDSEYAFSPAEMAKRLVPRTSRQELADATFRLGAYFQSAGKHALATRYWQRAQELNPDSWNYHRQDWSYTPAEAGRNWFAKFQALGDKPYYQPMELPAEDGNR